MRSVCAVAVLAGTLLLSGCAGSPTMPAHATPSASTPAESVLGGLVGGFWAVRGAAGEPSTTRLRIGPRDADVFRSKGRVDGSLAAQGDHLLWQRSGWSMSLGDDTEAPWLSDAATIEPAGDGWRLLDADGRPTAELVPGDAPPESKQYETDPTPDLAGVDLLRDAVLPAGVEDRPAADLRGTWNLSGYPRATVTFAADGSWRANGSCGNGIGGGGGAGEYRVVPGGRLLLTALPIAGVGCLDPTPKPPADEAAVLQTWRARSFAVAGDRLTLFVGDGTALGTLIR